MLREKVVEFWRKFNKEHFYDLCSLNVKVKGKIYPITGQECLDLE
jgi:hypothetical protein